MRKLYTVENNYYSKLYQIENILKNIELKSSDELSVKSLIANLIKDSMIDINLIRQLKTSNKNGVIFYPTRSIYENLLKIMYISTVFEIDSNKYNEFNQKLRIEHFWNIQLMYNADIISKENNAILEKLYKKEYSRIKDIHQRLMNTFKGNENKINDINKKVKITENIKNLNLSDSPFKNIFPKTEQMIDNIVNLNFESHKERSSISKLSMKSRMLFGYNTLCKAVHGGSILKNLYITTDNPVIILKNISYVMDFFILLENKVTEGLAYINKFVDKDIDSAMV